MSSLRQFRSVRLALLLVLILLVAATGMRNAAADHGDLQVEDLTGAPTADSLVDLLLGASIDVVPGSVAFTGHDSAAGEFSHGDGIIGIDAGVVLSTGHVVDVVGPNIRKETSGGGVKASRNLGQPGDADLNAIVSPRTTNDAAILEFEFEAPGDAENLYFQYVFGSEEYNEWVGSAFNDVFAFFVNGENCALIDGDPVSVNNVNIGVNDHLFIDNTAGGSAPFGHLNTELDGLTVPLTCTAAVNPGAVNTVKLAIADTTDTIVDSAVFIEAGSFSFTPPVEPTVICYDLIAGQHIVAGEVCVSNDDENLYVEYTTTGGWVLIETHLAVSWDETGSGEWTANGWQNRTGNPAPGRFPHSESHDEETSYLYTIALIDIGGEGDELNIAAHAVVEKEDVIAEATAPYFASNVVESSQGQRADGSDVVAARSDPEQALAQEADSDDSKMFSLGFGGSITVEFTCPIQNGGEGVDDLSIWEVTNPGSYPLEQARVEVSQDGETWFEVGFADNTTPQSGRLTLSSFDLTAAGLDWAAFVRITDTSDPELFEPTADGFDLDGIQANTDCRISEIERETAWGEGPHFVDRGNWAMYFTYELETLGEDD